MYIAKPIKPRDPGGQAGAGSFSQSSSKMMAEAGETEEKKETRRL